VRLWRAALCLGLLAFGAGCSTVTDYTRVTVDGQAALARFDFSRAESVYGEGVNDPLDGLCYQLEYGTTLHTAGEYVKSNTQFQRADATIEEFDRRAVVSARDVAADAGTLLLNDKAAPYRGEPFERVYVHAFGAMNYLLLGDLSGARVEARRAYNRQRMERTRCQEEFDAAARAARQRGVFDQKAVDAALGPGGALPANREVEVFQDAFSFYLASVVYEALGEFNNAQVEIRNLLSFRSSSRMGQEQARRLEAKLTGKAAGGFMAAAKGGRPALPKDGEGEVVVFYACGLAPVKREQKIRLPLNLGQGVTWNAVAFPTYESRPNPVAEAFLRVNGRALGKTEILSDVETKARDTLASRMPAMVFRALVRVAARLAAQQAILSGGQRRGGPMTHEERRQEEAERLQRQLAALFVGLAGDVVEQADLRSWLSLPMSFQVARGVARAGRPRLRLELLGPGGALAGAVEEEIEVRSGRITVVVVRSIGLNAVMRWKAL